MRLLIMGAPGAGKGTQAALIEKKYGIVHISTGDIFRKAIVGRTEAGNAARSYIDRGDLVPDELTVALVRDRLREEDCEKGFLLDGFPRTIAQAEALDVILKELGTQADAVLNIHVNEKILISRITGRMVCPQCGAAYHITGYPPVKEGICDCCGGRLVHRPDDEEETIANRLSVYYRETKPVLGYYEKKNLVRTIDGTGGIDHTFKEIEKILKEIENDNDQKQP